MENWKEIPEFEGLYQVSDLGRVRSVAFGIHKTAGSVLKTTLTKNGYGIVRLWKNSKVHPKYVHRLVALAFIGDYPPGNEVNHIDGNRLNNALENLEYVTRSENNLHAYRVLGRKPAPSYGERHRQHKLSYQKAQEIRTLRSMGISMAEIGRRYGVDWSTVRDVVQNKTWRKEVMPQ